MNDLYLQLVSYAHAMWRKRWYIALIAWVICIPGWIGVMLLPDRFESSARIYVDTDNLLSPLLRGLSVEGNVGNQVDFMQRTLLSRPNVEKLMRMTDLDLAVKTQNDKDQMVADIARRTSISQNQGRNLFSVSFNDRSPEIAQRVVQSLLSIFVESNVGASRTDIEKARQFLDVQISQYEKQLQTAEARLAEYKKTHLEILSHGANGGSFQQVLDQTKTQRLDVKGQLDDAMSKRAALQKQLDSVPPVISFDAAPQFVITPGGARMLPPALQALQTRIDDTQKALDTMKLRFTEKHPDVIATKKQLEDLQHQYDELEKKIASGKADEATGGGVKSVKASQPNPLFEQVKMLQVNNEAVISALERRMQNIDADIKKFEALAVEAPQIEAELATLNRDYNVLRGNYDQLIQRREAAKLADAVETTGEKIQFRIVDPPQIPSTPSGPPRLIFMSAVLVGSLAAGVVVAFLMSQLDDTFFSLASLRDAVGLPVLGGISRILSPGERRMRIIRTATFAASLGVLFMTYGAIAIILLRDKIMAS
jgi:polysaccharide chain length determinant protein (PEP-CTERM system associated)